MSITGFLVLLSVTWFMVFFCVLPVRFRSQAEAGRVEPGTPASAPEDPQLKKKAWITTGIALVIWAVMVAIIASGVISVRDLDVFGVMPSPAGL